MNMIFSLVQHRARGVVRRMMWRLVVVFATLSIGFGTMLVLPSGLAFADGGPSTTDPSSTGSESDQYHVATANTSGATSTDSSSSGSSSDSSGEKKKSSFLPEWVGEAIGAVGKVIEDIFGIDGAGKIGKSVGAVADLIYRITSPEGYKATSGEADSKDSTSTESDIHQPSQQIPTKIGG